MPTVSNLGAFKHYYFTVTSKTSCEDLIMHPSVEHFFFLLKNQFSLEFNSYKMTSLDCGLQFWALTIHLYLPKKWKKLGSSFSIFLFSKWKLIIFFSLLKISLCLPLKKIWTSQILITLWRRWISTQGAEIFCILLG